MHTLKFTVKFMTNIYYVHDRYISFLCMVYDLQDCVTTTPPIHRFHTTLEIAVRITTLHQPFPTQTACGLCVFSSSSNVLCVLNATKGCYNRFSADMDVNLVFFSAFLAP